MGPAQLLAYPSQPRLPVEPLWWGASFRGQRQHSRGPAASVGASGPRTPWPPPSAPTRCVFHKQGNRGSESLPTLRGVLRPTRAAHQFMSMSWAVLRGPTPRVQDPRLRPPLQQPGHGPGAPTPGPGGHSGPQLRLDHAPPEPRQAGRASALARHPLPSSHPSPRPGHPPAWLQAESGEAGRCGQLWPGLSPSAQLLGS